MTGRGELDLFCQLPYALNEELAGDLDCGRRRPERMWMALRGDQLVARLAWWARQKDGAPVLLDVFDFDDATDERGCVNVGVMLLETAIAEVFRPALAPRITAGSSHLPGAATWWTDVSSKAG